MRSRRGVTLVEIAIVVALIGVMAAIGAGMLGETVPAWRTRRAATEFYTTVNAARTMAISDGVEYRIWFEATDPDPSTSATNAGTYWVQKGDAATESSSWDTLPVEMDGANALDGEGYVNLADGEQDSNPSVSIRAFDPELVGPSHGGSDNAIHFGPSGMLLNDADDFTCDVTGDGNADGFICVAFVNKDKAEKGADDVWTVSISRAGFARMFHSDADSIGYSVGTSSTSQPSSSSSGYGGGSGGSEDPT